MNPAFIALGGANIGLLPLALAGRSSRRTPSIYEMDQYYAKVKAQEIEARKNKVFQKCLEEDAAERRKKFIK